MPLAIEGAHVGMIHVSHHCDVRVEVDVGLQFGLQFAFSAFHTIAETLPIARILDEKTFILGLHPTQDGIVVVVLYPNILHIPSERSGIVCVGLGRGFGYLLAVLVIRIGVAIGVGGAGRTVEGSRQRVVRLQGATSSGSLK